MYYNQCVCGYGYKFQDRVIAYKNDSIFRNYTNYSIYSCPLCGVHKTISAKKVILKVKSSNIDFYYENLSYFKKIFKPLIICLKSIQKTGRFLDVGCSSGIMMKVIEDEGYEVYGIEPNVRAYNEAKGTFGNRVFFGNIHKYLINHHKKFDIVLYNHVLEHIFDPILEIHMSKKLLTNNGLLAIGIPNRRNIIFKLRNKYWEYLLPDQHIWHFSDDECIKFVEKQGFKLLIKTYSNDERRDYPLVKKLYFRVLNFVNRCIGTGESVFLVFKNDTCKLND